MGVLSDALAAAEYLERHIAAMRQHENKLMNVWPKGKRSAKGATRAGDVAYTRIMLEGALRILRGEGT